MLTLWMKNRQIFVASLNEYDAMTLKMAVRPNRLTQHVSTPVIFLLENTSDDVLTNVRMTLEFNGVLLLAGDKTITIPRLIPGRVVEEELQIRADEEEGGTISVHDISYRDALGRIQEARDQIFAFSINRRQARSKSAPPTRLQRARRVFYSYAHEDEDLCKQLRKHLSVLRREGYISEWHDRQISPGSEWKGEIDNHLRNASIILLLISSDFLASDYCYDQEMKTALRMHREKKARVIPVILRACDWHRSPFAELQALPKDGLPIKSRHWHDEDEALTDVANGLRRLVG